MLMGGPFQLGGPGQLQTMDSALVFYQLPHVRVAPDARTGSIHGKTILTVGATLSGAKVHTAIALHQIPDGTDELIGYFQLEPPIAGPAEGLRHGRRTHPSPAVPAVDERPSWSAPGRPAGRAPTRSGTQRRAAGARELPAERSRGSGRMRDKHRQPIARKAGGRRAGRSSQAEPRHLPDQPDAGQPERPRRFGLIAAGCRQRLRQHAEFDFGDRAG